MRRMPARHWTIQLTTFRRHETTMDATMLKTRTTTRTRSMGRVAQLRACSENGECLQPMNPSNQHAKASGRTLSLGGSQILARKGRDFISLQRYLTLAPNSCLSVTTNTSPRPGKTRVTHFFQWSLNVLYGSYSRRSQ